MGRNMRGPVTVGLGRNQALDGFFDDMARLDEGRAFEQQRPKTQVPILGTVAEVEALSHTSPDFPFVGVDAELPIREIGKALYGVEGFNRIKDVRNQHNFGPHFDAYARSFGSWMLRTNNDVKAEFRGIFLPQNLWNEYKERTNDLHQSELTEADMYSRRSIGTELLKAAEVLFVNPLQQGTRTLLWQGGLEEGVTAPAVYDVFRFDHSLNSVGVRDNRDDPYTLYARQFDTVQYDFVEI